MAQKSCKPASRTEPPWGTYDIPSDRKSTYSQAFLGVNIPITNRAKPIIPVSQHPWTSEAKFSTKSTTQDAYQNMGGGPQASFKPKLVFQPTAPLQPYTTTNRAQFVPHDTQSARRLPFVPARRDVDGSKFDTTSTQQDAYKSHVTTGYRPRRPIYPVQRVSTPTTFENTSTSRASYTQHVLTPYAAAKKPPGAMGSDGMMA
jgi:hypothetical protein